MFALSHVLTFSHLALKLQHRFQLSLVCKQINSANTFQILSRCKTNIVVEKSNYRTDSSSTKQHQRFLLISQLSLSSQNSLSSYFYQDKKMPLNGWTLKPPPELVSPLQPGLGSMLSSGLCPHHRLWFGGCKTWGGMRCQEGCCRNSPSSHEELAAGWMNDL